MTSLASLAARYRWELLLVIGIPLAADVVAGLMTLRPEMFSFLPHWLLRSLPGFFFVLLLGLSYLRVRLLGRRTLSLVWAYALTAMAAVSVARWIAIELVIVPGHLELNSQTDLLLQRAPPMLATLTALGWFGRQASKMSLGHAFLLVGISVVVTKHFSSTQFLLFLASDSMWGVSLSDLHAWLASLALIGVLSLLAIRALRRFDSADSGDRRRMILQLTAGSLLYRLLTTSQSFVPVITISLKVSLTSAMYIAAYYAAAFGLVWLLRVRGERDREPIA